MSSSGSKTATKTIVKTDKKEKKEKKPVSTKAKAAAVAESKAEKPGKTKKSKSLRNSDLVHMASCSGIISSRHPQVLEAMDDGFVRVVSSLVSGSIRCAMDRKSHRISKKDVDSTLRLISK